MPAERPAPGLQMFTPGFFTRLIARPGFQRLVDRMPIGRSIARRDGDKIFDILQGFVKSQVLLALVELDILARLLERPASADQLALSAGVQPERLRRLLSAGAGIGLLRQRRDGRYALSRQGAAILGVPGLVEMIRHNAVFYKDMADPVALLRGEEETHLAGFWPYVFGASGDVPGDVAERYSTLMAESQSLVAQDTLGMVNLSDVDTLLDVGGGSGAFLKAVLQKYPKMTAQLLDLPGVIPSAERNFAQAGLGGRVRLMPGSFRDGPLPKGADAISLVRVLYDHADGTVTDLLAKVFEALPPGGRLIVTEPMSGGDRPDVAGDVYFNFYTMAMGTGCVRSAVRIAEMCEGVGFGDVKIPRAPRPYVTSALTCRKPDT